MTQAAACPLSLAVDAPGLCSAQPGATPDTVLPGQSKYHAGSKPVDLTIIAREGNFLR